MNVSFLRGCACAIVLLASAAAGATAPPLQGAGNPEVMFHAVVLPKDAHFEGGSDVLSVSAQHFLQGELDRFETVRIEGMAAAVMVSGAKSKSTNRLAAQRVRSLSAFLVLNGIDPERIHRDASRERNGRSNRIEVEFAQWFVW